MADIKVPSATGGAVPSDIDVSRSSITQDDHDAIDKGLDEASASDQPDNTPAVEPKTPEAKPDPETEAPETEKDPAAPVKPEAPKKSDAKTPATPKKDDKPAPAKPKVDPDPKKEQTPTPPAKTPPETEKKPEDFDKEIDSIQKPKNLSPANDVNFEALRAVAKKYKKDYQTAVAAAAELEKQRGKMTPETEKELADLRTFRRMNDIRQDPEFISQFDGKVKQNNEDVYTLLAKGILTPEVLTKFKEAGGIDAYPLAWWYEYEQKNEKGETVKVPGWLTLMQRSSDPEVNKAAVVIENKLKQNAQLAFDKEEAVKKSATEKSEWVQKKEKEAAEKKSAEDAYCAKRIEEVKKDFQWTNEMKVPENATEEEKAAIEAHNQRCKIREEQFRSAFNPPNIQSRLETAFAAVLSFQLIDDMEAMKKEQEQKEAESTAKIAALEEQLENLKNAGRMPKGGATPPRGEVKPKGNNASMSNEAAIDAGIDEAMANS